MQLAGLLVEVFEVGLQLAHGIRRRDGSVTRHDHLDIEREDALAGGDPVGHRSGPHDRVTSREEDVSRIERPLSGHVHKRVTARVRGADLQQAQLA